MSRVCKLANQSILLVVESPGGVYNADQLQLLGSYLDEEGLIAKVTEDQRLTVAVAEDEVEALTNKLAEAGLGARPYREGLHQPVSCLGAQCTLHDQDALGDVFKLTSALAGRELDGSLRIGINGCAASCVPIHTLDIAAIGEAGGYRLSIGGKNSQIPEMAAFVAEGIPAEKLTGLIGKVIDVYQQHAEGEESLQAVIERIGVSPFVEVLAPYSQDAADDSDPFGSLVAEPEADSQDDDSSPEEIQEIDEDELEAELLADLADEQEPDSSELETQQKENQETDELAGLGDLDVSADRHVEQELDDDLVVQEEPSEHMVDINPGEMADGNLDDEVPITETASAEDDFSPELLEVDDSHEEAESELDAGDTSELEDLDEDVLDEDPLKEDDGLEQLAVADNAGAGTEKGADLDQLEDDFSELETDDASFGTFDDIDEIDEDAERELEGKIEESIAEQANLGEISDENLEDRNAALQMVSERDSDQEPFELNSFEQETSFDTELDELEADYVEEAPAGDERAFQQMQGMTFERGKVQITFASGATLVIDFQRMKDLGGRRSFNIDGQQIDVRIEGEEVFISVDGVEVNLAIPIAA